jgi:hypothetical protein
MSYQNARKAKSLRAAPQGKRVKKTANPTKIFISLVPSYPKQVVWQSWLPAAPRKLTTTVTTGLIADAYTVSFGIPTNFATRFGSTWVEARVVRAKFAVRMFSSTNSGVLRFWYDEKLASAPTLVEAQERAMLSVNASDITVRSAPEWTCTDITDLGYLSVSAPATKVTFKSYTDNANFGSSIIALDYCEICPEVLVQFRGLQGI